MMAQEGISKVRVYGKSKIILKSLFWFKADTKMKGAHLNL